MDEANKAICKEMLGNIIIPATFPSEWANVTPEKVMESSPMNKNFIKYDVPFENSKEENIPHCITPPSPELENVSTVTDDGFWKKWLP